MLEQTQTLTIADLRAELKAWEKSFARTHDGRKPSRSDIKNDNDIAEKYKIFHRLSSNDNEENNHVGSPKKRTKSSSQIDHVPAEKRICLQSATPLKKVQQATQEEEPTPAHIKCALGPTPQKDGQVLGLFDLLNSVTPSSSRFVQTDNATTPSNLNTHTVRLSRTPQSDNKRFYLDMLGGATPKRKRAEDDVGTPSTAKRQLFTPAFLRRGWQVDDHSQRIEPFKAKRGLVRSLSSMIADMRKQENDEADEEWEIMNELENEAESEKRPRPVEIQIQDSQAVEMPLGPDELPASDESDGPAVAERKPWKKKGLKRQTKRVKMKPAYHAPQKATIAMPEDEDDDGDDDNVERIAETQASAAKDDGQNKENRPVQKALRKVSALAHANYRKLKIKSKSTKVSGKRFGRR